MLDVNFFSEVNGEFTVFIVERRFVVGQGLEFFKSFQNKPNYLMNEKKTKENINKILKWTQKNIPNIANLIQKITMGQTLNIFELITDLNKLFTVHEHQAVGPEVLDPIIIEEQNVSTKTIAQLISLYKSSILRPCIIILLKDNDFDRAKELLSKCQHGLNIKMIRNSGEIIDYKIINCGAENVEDFFEAFSLQCFSTCSKTSKNILLNSDFTDNTIINHYSPQLLRIRSNLLFDEKDIVRNDINHLLSQCLTIQGSSNDITLGKNIECMIRLFRIYCNDAPSNDLSLAEVIAKNLDNELLLAHVYRYSNMLNTTFDDRQARLQKAELIFQKNNIEDHSIYCKNNRLVNTFYTDNINTRDFKNMQAEAVNNVPGLVGMSIILNNVGVAYLYSCDYENAITYFKKGLDYSSDRIVQDIGLRVNILIAKSCAFETITEKEIHLLLRKIFTVLGTKKFTFLSASYLINIISITLQHHPDLFNQIITEYAIIDLIQRGLDDNILGSGSLCAMLDVLKITYSKFSVIDIKYPTIKSEIDGIRANFILAHKLNPMIFNAWL